MNEIFCFFFFFFSFSRVLYLKVEMSCKGPDILSTVYSACSVDNNLDNYQYKQTIN